MATITQVTMGREGHYRVTRIRPGTSATLLGRCECGDIWVCALNELYDSFSDWMLQHPTPPRVGAAVTWSRRPQCTGSGEPIHEDCTDRDGVGLCPICRRDEPTSPEEGYAHWRTLNAHPAPIGVTP
jgi:hypothetical protein